MSDKIITTPEKLQYDFDKFTEKLNLLPEKLKSKYDGLQKDLKEILSTPEIERDETKLGEFYLLLGRFTEESNLVKVLYQVLLEEYSELGIFSPDDYLEMKNNAAARIASHIRSGSWFGVAKDETRAEFRFEMLKIIRRRVHLNYAKKAETKDRIAAVCFSGGGIRSATFGLGVLQGLAKHNLLSKFEYISTVSGGGYIGSWLSAWIHRINNPSDKYSADKPFTNDDVKTVEEKLVMQTAETPEPEEITHLRSYSNYMSPRTGLFSTDTWTLVAVYLRNLLLNWTVFVPLIAAFLLIPKFYSSVLRLNPDIYWQWVILIISVVFGIGVVMNINAMRPSLEKYSWVDQRFKEDDLGILKSVEGKIFRWVFLWVLVLSFGITTFWVWTEVNFRSPTKTWITLQLNSGDALFFYCILLGVAMFFGGYLLAWIIMLPKFFSVKNKEKEEAIKRNEEILELSFWQQIKDYFSTYIAESVTAVICGIVSGALLYVIISNLGAVSDWFRSKNLLAEFWVSLGVPLFLLVFLLAMTLFVGLAARFTNDEDREWLSRLGALVLIFIVGWSVLSSAVLFGPKIFTYDWKGSGLFTALGSLSGLVTLVMGFSGSSSGKVEGSEPQGKTSFLMWFAPAVAAPIFVLFLVILISYLTSALIGYVTIFTYYRHLVWFLIFALTGILMGFFININKFSIHSIYRERLIRAYLGASRTKRRLFTANSFTGLDSEKDNIEMRWLRQKPMHVVNMTLNLVKTQNLRWQNRKAESFTATALYCGSSNMGEGSGTYRSSEEYGLNAISGKALTLGTAAAISGAAASPNMGYYTMSAAVSFLMVMFNVRLGWWLGNPGRRGERYYRENSSIFEKLYTNFLTFFNLHKTYNQPAPRWSPRLFLDESIGGTDDSKPYIYLSDGGHFDNLGLYEMVLRRCHLIVVSDAACDAEFEFSDFGTSIHKIRVDMGIPIEFDRDNHPAKNRNCGIGKIRYKCVDGADAHDGIIIYIKPTLDGDEPIDLKNYKKEHPHFPHESTADQMYSETQFESYRSLGFHQLNSICCRQEKCKCKNLLNLEVSAKKYLEMFLEKQNAETPENTKVEE